MRTFIKAGKRNGNPAWACLSPSILILLALLSLGACHRPQSAEQNSGKEAPSSSATAERRFDVRGILHAIDLEDETIMVEHEEIPGFMPAMTMPFYYKDRDEVTSVPLGSAIAFQFVVTESDSWVTGVRVIDADQVKRLPTQSEPKARAERVREGDRMPDFNLVDQAKNPVNRKTLEGRATLLTFIFVRCPVPNFCPLMSSRFAELQGRLAGSDTLKEKVHLLSISFDPLDTPDILAFYSENLSANPKLWSHVGGPAEETEKLTQAFAVYVREESGIYSHGLCTALVKADGTIAKIWRGNDWSVDEVWKEIEAL